MSARSVELFFRQPWPPWLTSQLMQKTQRRLQFVRKTVPDPPRPTSERSSPKCGR